MKSQEPRTILKVLFIEDNPDDVLIMVELLNDSGNSLSYKRVETKPEIEELNLDDWDCVISDNQMPRLTGLEALQNVRKKNEIIPFILVSGTVGDELAVEFMKEGANDYVMKDRLVRLSPAVEREVKDAKMRTQKIEAEKELYKNQMLYRSLSEDSNDAIYLTIDNKFVFINPAFEKLFTYSLEELKKPGVDFNKIVAPESKSFINNRIERKELGERVDTRFEFTAITKLGEKKEVEALVSFIEFLDDKATQGIIRDITERKELINDLNKNKERAEQAERIADLGHWEWNLETNKIIWSKQSCDIFEIDSSLVNPTYEMFFEKTHPADRERVKKEYEKSVVNKTPLQITHRILTENGTVKYVEERGKTIYNSDGKAIKSIGTVQDVTKLKEREKEIIKFSAAVNSSLTANVLADLKGNIIYINAAAEKIWGYKPEEVIGKSAVDFWVNKIKAQEVVNTVLTQKSWKGEMQTTIKDGTVLDLEIAANLVIDNNGEPICLHSSLQDITERKRYETNLNAALEKAQESDQLKSAFLANLSHEIRTPLNGILGLAHLLQQPQLGKEQIAEYTRLIEKSSDRMINMITDLIDISKIELGQIDVNFSKSDINEKIDYLYEFFKPQAYKKGLNFEVYKGIPDQKVFVKTDKVKLLSIISNLLENAIKYTSEGQIDFGYNIKKESIEFFVKDTGQGIPQGKSEVIFKSFVQADLSLSKSYEGAGLGLSIAKAYIDMLGGKIWVESEEGRGAQFYFTIPLQQEHNPLINDKSSQNGENEVDHILKQLSILIAEDDEITQISLKGLLKGRCKQLEFANNGKEAVELYANSGPFDLVLMDIKMPVMDGYSATIKIKNLDDDAIIVALTAYALAGDKEKAFAAGCVDYLAKPLMQEKLYRVIKKAFKVYR